MAQKRHRITVDIEDLASDIENCRSDAAWRELSLAGKIRTLLRERVDELLKEKSKNT